MRSLSGQIFAHRVTGQQQVRKSAGAEQEEEVEDAARARIRSAFQDHLRGTVWRRLVAEEPVAAGGLLVRRALRARCRGMSDLFAKYSTEGAGGGAVLLRLDGLRLLCRDCDLGCPCMGLLPHQAEGMFADLLDQATRTPVGSRACLSGHVVFLGGAGRQSVLGHVCRVCCAHGIALVCVCVTCMGSAGVGSWAPQSS